MCLFKSVSPCLSLERTSGQDSQSSKTGFLFSRCSRNRQHSGQRKAGLLHSEATPCSPPARIFLGKDGTCGHLAQSVFFRSLLPGRSETVLKWILLKRLISCFISQHIFLHMLKSLMFDTFFLEHWGQWSFPEGCPTNIQYDTLLKPLGNSAVYATNLGGGQRWMGPKTPMRKHNLTSGDNGTPLSSFYVSLAPLLPSSLLPSLSPFPWPRSGNWRKIKVLSRVNKKADRSLMYALWGSPKALIGSESSCPSPALAQMEPRVPCLPPPSPSSTLVLVF